jgi:hypothetical protein
MLNVTATQNGKLTDENKTCIEDFRKYLSDNRAGGKREEAAAELLHLCAFVCWQLLPSCIQLSRAEALPIFLPFGVAVSPTISLVGLSIL